MFFTEVDPDFGRISWTTTIIWLAALGLSAYFLTSWQTANPARRRFWRRWAIGTVVVAGLTVVALVLNFFEVPFFNIRAWIYGFSFLTLAYWAWAAYFYFTKLPAETAAVRSVRTAPGRPARATQRSAPQTEGRAKVYTNKTQQANGAPAPQPVREPRPQATTSRRDARRDRKRRSR